MMYFALWEYWWDAVWKSNLRLLEGTDTYWVKVLWLLHNISALSNENVWSGLSDCPVEPTLLTLHNIPNQAHSGFGHLRLERERYCLQARLELASSLDDQPLESAGNWY